MDSSSTLPGNVQTGQVGESIGYPGQRHGISQSFRALDQLDPEACAINQSGDDHQDSSNSSMSEDSNFTSETQEARHWTRPQVQYIIDKTLNGNDYHYIQEAMSQLYPEPHPRPLREYPQCIAENGPAREYFPGLPTYWDHTWLDQHKGVRVRDDKSELTQDEAEELILFAARGHRLIDPGRFLKKRSTAFLNQELCKVE